MALSHEQLKELAQGIAGMMDLLDSGVSANELRQRAAGIPEGERRTALNLLNAAEAFRRRSAELDAAARPVANPRYRKGTAMKPAKWDDCLWKPTP